MADIQVKIPSGELVTVRISGEEPNEQEKQKIYETYFANVEPEKPEITQENVLPTDIDYKTGVRTDALRFAFNRADNDRERRLELLNAGLPEGSFFQDDQGEFIIDINRLPEDVKDRYEIRSESGKNFVAIDEEGFTWEDVVDFGGAAFTPIAVGTAAMAGALAVATAPISLPILFAVGAGAGGLSYLLDETIDYSRGTRDQTLGEDATNFLFESAIGGVGEVGAGLLTRLFGRIFKGPGGKEANEARRLARDILSGEVDPVTGQKIIGKPTTRAATLSPLLGRAQAFYEGVFPNAKVATNNAKYMQAAFRNLMEESGVGTKEAEKVSGEFLQTLERHIQRMYSTPEELIKKSNENLQKTVTQEIDKLIARYGDKSFTTANDPIQALQVAKREFDENVQYLYGQAEDLMGDSSVIPTGLLKSKLNKIVRENPIKGEEIKGSALGKFIQDLPESTTPSMMQTLRTALREASYDPSLIGSQDKQLLKGLLNEVDSAFEGAEATILSGAFIPQSLTPGVKVKVTPKAEAVKSGLEALRRANRFYKSGIAEFDQGLSKELMSRYSKGGRFIDPDEVLEILTVPDRGKSLQNFLNTIRPTPRTGIAGRGVLPSKMERPTNWLETVPNAKIKTPDSMKAQAAEQGLEIADTINIRKVVEANPDTALAQFYKKRFADSQRFASQVDEAVAGGSSYKEAVRDSLAQRFIEKTVSGGNVTNINGRVDGAKVVEELRGLGSTAEALFGGRGKLGSYEKALAELSILGKETTEADLAQFAGRPITEQIEAISRLTGMKETIKGQSFVRALNKAATEGDIDQAVNLVMRSTTNINKAKNLFGDKSEVMEGIKNEVMARILSGLGDPASTVTKTRSFFGKTRTEESLSKEFVENVMKGKHATQIKNTIDKFGRDKMEALLGKDVIESLTDLARKSEAVSMKPLAGLAGLETSKYARMMATVAALFAAPFTFLTTMAGLRAAGGFLRSKTYLNIATRPTSGFYGGKGSGSVPQALEDNLNLAWSIVGRSLPQGLEEISSDTAPIVPRERQKYEINRIMDRLEGSQTRDQNIGAGSGVPTRLSPPDLTGTFNDPNLRSVTASDVERERVRRQVMGIQ
jgi:hypothetical protein